MKFKLRKKTGEKGTEINISVLFSPEETDHRLAEVSDDSNIHLDNLRVDGTDYQKADHALMVIRCLAHFADLWEASQDNPEIQRHLVRGKIRQELQREARSKRRRKRK